MIPMPRAVSLLAHYGLFSKTHNVNKAQPGDYYVMTEDCWFLDEDKGTLKKTKWMDNSNIPFVILRDRHTEHRECFLIEMRDIDSKWIATHYYHVDCFIRLGSKDSPLFKLIGLV